MGTFTFNPQHHVFQLQAKQTRTPSSINLPRKYLSIPIVKMKSASMIAVGAFAFTAVAQLESLPSCGQTCITNMLGPAPSLPAVLMTPHPSSPTVLHTAPPLVLLLVVLLLLLVLMLAQPPLLLPPPPQLVLRPRPSPELELLV